MIKNLLSKILFWAIAHKHLSSKDTARLSVLCLKDVEMSLEDKSLCTGALLDGLKALPLRTIISRDEQGVLHIQGKPVEYEQAVRLRESAIALHGSYARKVIDDQVRYAAIEFSINQGHTPEQIIFSRAALWFSEQQEDIINMFSQVKIREDA